MTKRIYNRILLATIITNLSCRTVNQPNAQTTLSSLPRDVPTLVCEKGDSAYFILKEPAQAIAKGDFDLKDFKANEQPWPIDVEKSFVRLDACSNGDELDLKRATMGDKTVVTIAEVGANAKIAGLKEAIFDGDYSQLRILIPTNDPRRPGKALYLLGSKKGGALASEVRIQDEKLEFSGLSFIGALEFVDPVTFSACDTVTNVGGEFKIGTATFAWKGVTRMGTSGGTAPSVCSMTVTDSSPELGKNAGKPSKVKFQGFESDDLTLKSNHHQVCDSLRIRTEYATYFVTTPGETSSFGVCEVPVAGGPVANAKGFAYRFLYGSKTVEGVEENCSESQACWLTSR